jgi:hypothetical protein
VELAGGWSIVYHVIWMCKKVLMMIPGDNFRGGVNPMIFSYLDKEYVNNIAASVSIKIRILNKTLWFNSLTG